MTPQLLAPRILQDLRMGTTYQCCALVPSVGPLVGIMGRHMVTHARSYFGCSFKIQKQKETTGRVVVWREFNVLNRYRPSAPQ
jgi:hypothetical protein